MKKSQLPEILACVVVLLIVAFFALWWKREQDRSNCIINIRDFQGAARGYIGMNAREFTAEEMWKEILVPVGYMRMRKCPSGGTYTLHDFSGNPDPGFVFATCSHADTLNHKPDGTDDW